jgi:anti-sigma factor RsiW
MTHPPCDRLDDYLARDLPGPERIVFAAHLAHCGACRQAVGEQERLAELLAHGIAELDPVPVGLAASIDRRFRAARRRRAAGWAAALAGAAAAVALCLAGGRLTHRAPPTTPVSGPVVRVAPSPPVRRPAYPRSEVRVSFRPQPGVIAVPQKTEHANVTILWVYPAVESARRAAAPRATPPPASERKSS